MRVLACGCYSVISDYLGVAKRFWVPFAHLYAFTFTHLVDAFIQSDLQCVSWELNTQPFALLTQCSTTEPQEHMQDICHRNICRTYATETYAGHMPQEHMKDICHRNICRTYATGTYAGHMPQKHVQFLECYMQFPGLCYGVLNVAMPF